MESMQEHRPDCVELKSLRDRYNDVVAAKKLFDCHELAKLEDLPGLVAQLKEHYDIIPLSEKLKINNGLQMQWIARIANFDTVGASHDIETWGQKMLEEWTAFAQHHLLLPGVTSWAEAGGSPHNGGALAEAMVILATATEALVFDDSKDSKLKNGLIFKELNQFLKDTMRH